MPLKVTRKILKIGNSLGITFPKTWVNCEEGEEVIVIANSFLWIIPKELESRANRLIQKLQHETPVVEV